MSDTITGTTVAGRYKVTGFLRPGRMGDIYVARRLGDDAKVVVKFLEKALFENDEAVARFERESKVARAIDHPCTIRVLEFGRSELGPYLVTEFVEGELLSDVIEDKGALTPERAALVTARIALALQAAHDKGVVHRDLAPSNVLLGRQGDKTDLVKVSDFGLALLTHDDDGQESTHLTAVGVRIGTPTYMAPEYIEEYELDHRADIYGLGVMLFEMLTGAPPFAGRPYKVMDAHVNEPMPKPSSRRSEVPAWLDDLVNRMTAKRPDQRLQSGGEVAEAIARGLGRAIDLVEYQAPTAEKAPKRQEQPKAPPPRAGDPILEHFLANNAGTVTRSKSPAPPADRRFVVARVAAGSVAGRLGIGVGWFAHLPDEQQEGLLDPALHHHVVRERRWWFWKGDDGERLEVVSSGLPIGVELVRSPDNVIHHFDPLMPEVTALLDLWTQKRWEDLERAAWRTLTQSKSQGGLLSRFMGGEKPKLFDHPALLFHGAALLEQKKPEGLRSVMDFKAKYASRWPSVYGVVADLYLAEASLRSDRARAGEIVKAAVSQVALPRLQALHKELFGEEANTSPWVGLTWSDYSMDSVDRRSSARLSETLEGMDSSELLAVCMLGGFRTNADYDEFMHRWAHYSAFFSPFLHALHIVTASNDVVAERPEVFRGEGVVVAAGLPVLLLHDYRAFVQRAVKPANIPTIFLLDQRGTCVHEGRLSPCDLWEALSLAGKIRIERFTQGGHR